MNKSFKEFISEGKLRRELVLLQNWLERSGIKTDLTDDRNPELAVHDIDGDVTVCYKCVPGGIYTIWRDGDEIYSFDKPQEVAKYLKSMQRK